MTAETCKKEILLTVMKLRVPLTPATLQRKASITQQGTPTRGKRTGTAGANIKTSRRANVTKKTGYNNTHKENALMI
jgi:hypothetical protein